MHQPISPRHEPEVIESMRRRHLEILLAEFARGADYWTARRIANEAVLGSRAEAAARSA